MSLDDKLINEINNKIILSDFIGRKVNISRRGREFIGLCPFHEEKTPSFTINDDKNFYHCFGCRAHGNVINFIMKDQNLDFVGALRTLCKELGLDFTKYSKNNQTYLNRDIENIKNILNLTENFFIKNFKSSLGKNAREYIYRRNVLEDVCNEFNIGYASKFSNNLFKYLLENSFSEDFIIRSGVVGKSDKNGNCYDFFRHRLIFPIHDYRGDLIAFGGRSLDSSEPKYLNSPDTMLFKKRRTLFNYHRAREYSFKQKRPLIVVEGYIDVISMSRAGISNVVAPLGTALSEDQILLLWRTSDEPIICMDGDKAGYRSAVRTLSIALPLLTPGKSIGFIFLPDGEDPDSMVQNKGKEEIEEILKTPLSMFDFCWKIEYEHIKLDTPERRAGFKNRFETKISLIKNYEVRREYKKSFNYFFSKYFSNYNTYSNKMYRGRDNLENFNVFKDNIKMSITSGSNKKNYSFSREKNLILAIINNPILLKQIDEEFSKVPFENNELNKIRSSLIDKFVGLGDINESDIENWFKDDNISILVEECFGDKDFKTNKLIPPYALKNSDLNFVIKGWREAANLQSLWYKKQRIKKYSKK